MKRNFKNFKNGPKGIPFDTLNLPVRLAISDKRVFVCDIQANIWREHSTSEKRVSFWDISLSNRNFVEFPPPQSDIGLEGTLLICNSKKNRSWKKFLHWKLLDNICSSGLKQNHQTNSYIWVWKFFKQIWSHFLTILKYASLTCQLRISGHISTSFKVKNMRFFSEHLQHMEIEKMWPPRNFYV